MKFVLSLALLLSLSTAALAREITDSESVALHMKVETLYAEYLRHNVGKDLPVDTESLALASRHADLLSTEIEQTTLQRIKQSARDQLQLTLKTHWEHIQKTKRIYGAAPMIALITTEVMIKVISFWALITGHYYVNAVIGSCPVWGETSLLATYGVQCMIMNQDLYKLYGGKDKYNAVHANYASIRKSTGFEKIITTSLTLGEESYRVKIAQTGLKDKIKRFFGFKTKNEGVTWSELKKILNTHSFLPSFVTELDQSHLTEDLKTFSALQAISKIGQADLISDIKLTFSDSFTTVESDLETLAHKKEYQDWITRCLSSKSLEELTESVANPPESLSTEFYSRTVDEIIIPELSAHHDLLNYTQYRRIINLGKELIAFVQKGHTKSDLLSTVRTTLRRVIQFPSCESTVST